QFLIEAVTLSVVGAAIGLAGGAGLVRLIAGVFPAGLPISLFGTTVSVGFAISIGLLAGLLPSIRASRVGAGGARAACGGGGGGGGTGSQPVRRCGRVENPSHMLS